MDPKNFSGSARQLFLALGRAGALTGVSNVEPSKFVKLTERGFEILKNRRRGGSQLLALWSRRAMSARAERARAILQNDETATAALLYGTNFFPTREDEAPRVPVGAAMDATFAQLARSGESWFGKIRAGEVDFCIEQQRSVLDRCAWLFPRSEWCARSLLDDYHIPREKIIVTGAGPNFDESPAPRDGYDTKTILFVGRDWNRKNGQLVLDAFRLARKARPDLELKIVGPRSYSFHAGGVEWLGPLDGARRGELLKLYSKASLLVFPSRFEPFGIAILEAMAAGCPVVAMNQWAAPEIIEEGVTGSLLTSSEPRPLAEQILNWLSDQSRLEAAGDAARARVREHYSWTFAARRIIDAFSRKDKDKTKDKETASGREAPSGERRRAVNRAEK